jgi:peptide deformylase
VAVRPILTFDNPVLREKAKKVARVDASIQRLIDDLTETMLDAPGAGLAANQIGYEGCLSYPGWVGEVARAETVVVKGRNRRGKEVRIKSEGFTARAFQHELDHLDGVLFTDKLTSIDTLRRVEELVAEAESEEAEEKKEDAERTLVPS